MPDSRAEQLTAFLEHAQQQVLNPHWRQHYGNLEPLVLSVEQDRPHARIVLNSYDQRSVFCLLDPDSGDILKAEDSGEPKYPACASLDKPEDWPATITPSGVIHPLVASPDIE